MLISDEYREQQKALHTNPEYGVASVGFAPLVTKVIDQLGVQELLDYGCGKGRLGQNLSPSGSLTVYQYDPAVPGFDEQPDPAEMVCCIDVLEHIEPDLLDNVLDELQRLTQKYGFFSIHTGPAVKTLPDGRNAHLIQADYTWWLPKIWERFFINTMVHTPSGFYVITQAIKWQ